MKMIFATMKWLLTTMFLLFVSCLIVTSPAFSNVDRSPATVRAFKHLHPCPANGKRVGPCPGWVVDHINPLACNGPDNIFNMQWQSTLDGKKKDRWEIRGNATHKPCSGLPN